LKPLAALIPVSGIYAADIQGWAEDVERFRLPPRSGKTIQFYTYKLPEGVAGA